MATKKPRITITLEPEQYELLRRLSDLQDTSMSKIVTQFLGEAYPVLLRVADTLEMAQKASDEAKAKFVRTVENAEIELRPLAEFAKNQFDMFAEQIGRLSIDDPRPVITGVKNPNEGEKKGRTDQVKPHKQGVTDEI